MVNVTRPFESLGPEAPEMTELAEPGWLSETVLPATRFESASLSVTVIVDVVEPSAVTLVGDAAIVETDALTDPAPVVIDGLVPVRFVGAVSSVAVTVWFVPDAAPVVKLTVAIPLAFVTDVGEPNEPPAPVFDHVTVLPATPVGVAFWSAS
jgi:hypothetical protein